MFEGKTVGIVVPCYNEQDQIVRVLGTMPDYVDEVIVVDDASPDRTSAVVQEQIDAGGQPWKLTLIKLEKNSGVGAAILAGYRYATDQRIDITAVMAGDGQMDPDDLPALLAPIARGQADYAKSNRLFYRNAWQSIPRHRYLGNAFLSMITKIASGYWHVADSQSGYTAISLEALRGTYLDGLYPRYGYPNDLLVRLNIYDMRVADVHLRPVYNVGEQSKMKIHITMPKMAILILRRFLWRLMVKYMIYDFHALVLFYTLGLLLLMGGGAFGLLLAVMRVAVGPIAPTSVTFMALLLLSGIQLTLFGMWFDMEYNRHLRVDVRRSGLPPMADARRNGAQPQPRQASAGAESASAGDEASVERPTGFLSSR